MPDGKTHASITTVAAGVLAIVMHQTGSTLEEIRLATSGCMTGLMLSPDLDVDGGFIGHSWVKKYFGEIVGRIWRAFWLPYAIIFPHRSDGSHIPVLSTAGRVIYLYGMYFAVCVAFELPLWIPSWHTAGYLFGGLVVSDTLHYIADKASTFLKKWRRYARVYFPMSEMPKKRRGQP